MLILEIALGIVLAVVALRLIGSFVTLFYAISYRLALPGRSRADKVRVKYERELESMPLDELKALADAAKARRQSSLQNDQIGGCLTGRYTRPDFSLSVEETALINRALKTHRQSLALASSS